MHVLRCLPCLRGIRPMAYNYCFTILDPNEDKIKDWGEPLVQSEATSSDTQTLRPAGSMV